MLAINTAVTPLLLPTTSQRSGANISSISVKPQSLYGLKTVMVTNGYITHDAFHDIYDHIDAANVDLKAFTESFYGKITLTHLEPVLDMLGWLKNETPGLV